MRASPGPRWALRAGLVLATVLLVAAGAELVARAALPESYYLLPPERRPQEVPRLRHVGPALHHVRADLPAPAADADEVRILFLGDSFTYGSGVADADLVFVRRIERALNEAPPQPGKRYVCFDAGIPGSMTYDWRTIFEDAAPRFRPHVVLPVFFLRNGQLGARSIGEIKKMTEALEARHAASALFRHSRLARFFAEQTEQRRLGREYLAEMESGYLGAPAEREEWKQAQLNLCALRDDAADAGAAFGVAVFPVLFGLDGEYVLARAVDAVLRAARAHGMPALSLLPAFAGKRAESLWVSKTDQHPNEEGHALAAEALLPFVVELLAHAPDVPRWAEATPAAAAAPAPADPEDQALLARLLRARGLERQELQTQLVARGAELVPVLAAGLADPEGTPAALTVLAALAPEAFGAAMPAFLAAAGRNGAVALASTLPEKVLGGRAAPYVRAGLRTDAAAGALLVLGRVDMFGDGLRSSWPLLGDAAAEIVELLVGARDERLARVATVALGRLGAPAADALLPRLAADDAATRARAATALGYLGPTAPASVVAPLAARLADENAGVRAAAARALWQVVPVSGPARAALEAAADDPSEDVRSWAGLALAELERAPE